MKQSFLKWFNEMVIIYIQWNSSNNKLMNEIVIIKSDSVAIWNNILTKSIGTLVIWNNTCNIKQYLLYETLLVTWNNACIMKQYLQYETMLLIWNNTFNTKQ